MYRNVLSVVPNQVIDPSFPREQQSHKREFIHIWNK